MIKENMVSNEAYGDLLKQLDTEKKKLDILRGENLFIGVRWYGDGGYAIGLAKPIRGLKKVTLQGYGDKAIINFEDWVRLDSTLERKGGVIVRDDSVIKEFGIQAYTTGDKDFTKNPNAYTDTEIRTIINGSISKLKKVMASVTDKFAPKHFRRVAEKMDIDSLEKMDIIFKREQFLFNTYNYGNLHHHDLTQYCETNNIRGWQDMDDKEKVVAIVKDLEK